MDENKEKDVNENTFQLTDIRLTAFLLSFDDFKLKDVERKIDIKNQKKGQQNQCVFILINKGTTPAKQWMLDYQNEEDRVKVSIHRYNKKLDDLRDMINSI